MKVIIDKFTDEIQGINKSPSLTQISLEIDDINLSKKINVVDGKVQKTNDNGVLLFKDNTETDTNGEEGEVWDETTESKKPISYTESVEEYHIMKDGVVRKKDSDGLYLYYNVDGQLTTDVTDDYVYCNESTGEIVTEPYEVITKNVKKPDEYEELEPVMVDNVIEKVVSLRDKPEKFTLDEVLEVQYQKLLDNEPFANYIVGDLYINEDDLDLGWSEHYAHTGINILQLPVNGKARTNVISLDTPTNSFMLVEADIDEGVIVTLNGQPFVDGKLELSTEVTEIQIGFTNETTKLKSVSSYIVGY